MALNNVRMNTKFVPEGSYGSKAVAIAPHASDVFDPFLLYVGGAGNVSVIPAGQTAPALFTAVPAGTTLPVLCIGVRVTGTSATNLMRID